MKFKKSTKSDIDNIMKIITQAQNYFKEKGIDQWQNNYPNAEVISNDIVKGESYVLIKDEQIIATTVITFKKEKTYETIYNGQWISENQYGTIHRIAVDNAYKGLGLSHKIIKYAEEICLNNDVYSLRVDTHEDNIPMQNLLKKNEFKYCGVIYLEDGAKRIAFEKILEKN